MGDGEEEDEIGTGEPSVVGDVDKGRGGGGGGGGGGGERCSTRGGKHWQGTRGASSSLASPPTCYIYEKRKSVSKSPPHIYTAYNLPVHIHIGMHRNWLCTKYQLVVSFLTKSR